MPPSLRAVAASVPHARRRHIGTPPAVRGGSARLPRRYNKRVPPAGSLGLRSPMPSAPLRHASDGSAAATVKSTPARVLDGFRIERGLGAVRGSAPQGLDHPLNPLLAQFQTPAELHQDHAVQVHQARSCSFGSRIVTSWLPGTSSMTCVTPLGHRISSEAFPSSPSPKCSLGSLQE